MNKYLEWLKQNRISAGLVFALIFLLLGGGFFVSKFSKKTVDTSQLPLEETDISFDPEGPYALLIPRKDGDAVYLKILRISSYDAISYSLAYTDKEGIDRGAGDLDTWINIEKGKSDYEEEILFGTCSKNVCKYDEGVENGTLTLRIKKGNKAQKMSLQWHLQQPDVALGILSSGDNHFRYKVSGTRPDWLLVGFSIINDVTGVPKLPDGKQVSGKVYSLNIPLARTLPKGDVTIELPDNPGDNAKIARYSETDSKWIEYDTKNVNGTLTASGDGDGIYAVLIPKK